ncbi:hypothetical protein CEXT_83591 [Caerostris extrusa]|uniref:Uncharacterized protein n=1 Tax=Caerostris extrusa TaxID=172846 RepID=A0AAV4PS82_CAEEX|nr:hypothetical protein CEXT_83591 [Caerostris extrusa]
MHPCPKKILQQLIHNNFPLLQLQILLPLQLPANFSILGTDFSDSLLRTCRKIRLIVGKKITDRELLRWKRSHFCSQTKEQLDQKPLPIPSITVKADDLRGKIVCYTSITPLSSVAWQKVVGGLTGNRYIHERGLLHFGRVFMLC